MEGAIVLLAVGSATAGFVLGGRIGGTAARSILTAGVAAIALGTLAILLVSAGWLSVWTGAVVTVVLLALGGLLLPFGLAACWRSCVQ
jgi:hypothetical protein